MGNAGICRTLSLRKVEMVAKVVEYFFGYGQTHIESPDCSVFMRLLYVKSNRIWIERSLLFLLEEHLNHTWWHIHFSQPLRVTVWNFYVISFVSMWMVFEPRASTYTFSSTFECSLRYRWLVKCRKLSNLKCVVFMISLWRNNCYSC